MTTTPTTTTPTTTTSTTTTSIAALPRVGLGSFPTPLHPAPRLSAALGVEVLLKRDDLTGVGLGGNKVRALEFLLGQGLAEGCDVLVTGAGAQSNWAMLAALCARRVGMDSVVCFYGGPPPALTGNLLLHRLTGARVRWTGDKDRASVDRLIATAADDLRAAGRRPLVLPRGGAVPRGSVGYVAASAELEEQLRILGHARATVWLATGSCGTQAGLVAASVVGGAVRGVTGVSVSRPADECRSRVAELAAGAAALVGLEPPAYSSVDVREGWIGPGYGIASPEGDAAAGLVAATEGVLLDPVFGAKAMAAMRESAAQGEVDGPVVFLVTGGAPTLFADGGSL